MPGPLRFAPDSSRGGDSSTPGSAVRSRDTVVYAARVTVRLEQRAQSRPNTAEGVRP